MAIRNVGFAIKIPLARETTATQKAIDKQKKTLVDMHKKDLPQLTKKTKEYLKGAKDGFRDTEVAAERMGRSFSRSMEDGLRSLNKFTSGVSKTREKILNLKTALAGTAVGIGAIWAGKKLYEGGKANLAVEGRINREFGDESGLLKRVAGNAGGRAGLSEDETIKALIPFRERLDDIEAGAQFRGMKKKLTATQAAALREKNLKYGANLFSRVSTLSPDIDPEQAGSVLADALSGPEGIKRLISEFNLSKRSRTVSAANEKGEVYKFLREDERKKYGVTKKGQYLEQGDLVDVLLQRSGITEGAADAKRRKLDFQIKAIGASAENALADIGARALDKFNNGMAKGATLSEKFEAAIKSKEGQRVLDAISTTVVSIAEGAVKVATELPKIGSFLGEHKTTLLALGGAFVGLKGMSFVGGKLGAAAKGEGVLGALTGGAGKPIPVYVTNMGGLGGGAPEIPGGATGKLGKAAKFLGAASSVFAAGSAGYALGSAADEYFGLSDKISKFASGVGGPSEAQVAARNETGVARLLFQKVNGGKETGAQAAAELERFARSAEGKDAANLSPEVKALIEAFRNQPPQLVQVVMPDGKVLAQVVTQHQVRKIKNDTANGTAPTHKE